MYQQAFKGCCAKEHAIPPARMLWHRVLLRTGKGEGESIERHLHIADVLWENTPSCANPAQIPIPSLSAKASNLFVQPSFVFV